MIWLSWSVIVVSCFFKSLTSCSSWSFPLHKSLFSSTETFTTGWQLQADGDLLVRKFATPALNSASKMNVSKTILIIILAILKRGDALCALCYQTGIIYSPRRIINQFSFNTSLFFFCLLHSSGIIRGRCKFHISPLRNLLRANSVYEFLKIMFLGELKRQTGFRLNCWQRGDVYCKWYDTRDLSRILSFLPNTDFLSTFPVVWLLHFCYQLKWNTGNRTIEAVFTMKQVKLLKQ